MIHGIHDYPEGTTSTCLNCGEVILLDQREGGGPGKDWGAGPDDWTGNGGIGMDYGCAFHPLNDDDGTFGHLPDLNGLTYVRHGAGFYRPGDDDQ